MYRSSVMIGVCPTKRLGLVEAKETEYLVKKHVYTAGLENCPVAEFVPARIAKGIHGPVNIKCRNSPPASPAEKGQISCDAQQEKLADNMNPGVPISAIGQLF